MVEEFSWDTDAARDKVAPTMHDTAGQVHAYAQPNTQILGYIQNGLGTIAHPVLMRARQLYADRQQWGEAAHAKLTETANGTIAATNAFEEHEDVHAAAIRQASENA